MSAVIPFSHFDYRNVYFHKAVHNMILSNSKFIRIMYSNGLVTLNNISLEAPITVYAVNKNRIFFDVEENRELILFFKNIEDSILERSDIKNRTACKKLTERLESGSFKFFSLKDEYCCQHQIILKISGLWETASDFGLTFKFVIGLPIGYEVGHNSVHD